MNPQKGAHRGNKAALPGKACLACGRWMSWRRAWARTWNDVRYCSRRCRLAARATRRAAPGEARGR